MKKIILQSIIFLSPIASFGQENVTRTETKRNTIYIEAFGQGLYNSFTFDRLYNVDKKIKTSFSAGLTTIPHPELFVVGTPVSYNFLFGQKNHHLELGIGITPMYLRQGRIDCSESVTDANGVIQTNSFVGYQNNFYSYFTPKIGYRFQKNTGGFFFRFTFTPSVAGINAIGGVQGGNLIKRNQEIQYFKYAAFFEPNKIFPWAGISIGWTLKH
jgi:hypothetical protein